MGGDVYLAGHCIKCGQWVNSMMNLIAAGGNDARPADV